MITHKFIWDLMDKLFEADKHRLERTVTKLCERNKQLKKDGFDGFMFSGRRYYPHTGHIIVIDRTQAMPTLDLSLHPEMMAHLRDQKAYDDERTVISQMLFQLLKPCKTNQDLRDALPECLVGFVPTLKGIRRQEEPAYTLRENDRAKRQYEKLLPKIEACSVGNLIY